MTSLSDHRTAIKLSTALLFCCSLLACSSKEERESKLILQEIMAGCMQTGAPKEMCQCVVTTPNLVNSAKLLAANKNDNERRVTFISQVHAYTVSCAESVLGIVPNREISPEAQRLLDKMIPRQ